MSELQIQKKKRGRKRGLIMPLRPAVPVRALWLHSSQEEKTKAHQIGIVIMEYWLGKITKEEAGKRLSIPSIRVWQLSQQAVSGMLAGLLTQPKMKVKGEIMDRDEDPKYLKKKIAELESGAMTKRMD